MRTVEIPGGSATFKESRSELRQRDAMLIQAAAMSAAAVLDRLPDDLGDLAPAEQGKRLAELHLSFQESMSLMEFRQAIVVATLAGWSLPESLPTMDTIGDLPSDLVAALEQATGALATQALITDFEPSPDPQSPTTPSSDSGGSLRVETPTSNLTWPSAGGSTATESSIPA